MWDPLEWSERHGVGRPAKYCQDAADWAVVTCDLWKGCGSFALTGMCLPLPRGGEASFDCIEMARSPDDFLK